MLKVDELANALQVCLDSGAKKVLLPIASAASIWFSIRARRTRYTRHWVLSNSDKKG